MTFPLPSFLRSAGALAAWLSGLAGAGAAEAPVPFTQASHEPRAPRAGEPVRIEVTAGSALSNVQVWTQTMDPGGYIELGDPGFAKGWVARPMTAGVSTNGAVRYGFQAPAEAQKNRRLVRYRFTANDAQGQIRHFPATNAVVPNLAYFVYDGIPAWTAAAAPRGRDPPVTPGGDLSGGSDAPGAIVLGGRQGTVRHQRDLARAGQGQRVPLHGFGGCRWGRLRSRAHAGSGRGVALLHGEEHVEVQFRRRRTLAGLRRLRPSPIPFPGRS